MVGELPDDVEAQRARELGIRSYVAVPVHREGAVRGCLCLVSGERRELDEEQLRSLETLAREVGLALDSIALRSRLRRLLREAERKNVELEAFVSAVSHELKTPLSVIRAAAEILGEDLAAELPRTAVEIFESIGGSVERMHGALESLLELSRIGLVAHPRELVPVAAVVEEAIALSEHYLRGRSIRLRRQLEAFEMRLDHSRIVEVLVNLLTNAAKYGCDPDDPEIVVSAGREGEWGFFRVADNGAGVPIDLRPQLFQPFRRGSVDRDIEGSGLGLFLARRIVESHGGKLLLVEGESSRGATFEARLPLFSTEAGEPSDEGEELS